MIRQLTRLTVSAMAVGALLLLLSPPAMCRQVGVKADPTAKPPAKTNAPPTKPIKRPAQTRPSSPPANSKADKQPASTSVVLSLIEKYKAPPFPKTQYIDRETYDYRLRSRTPVPPTLTDVLVCDVWQRLTADLKLSPSQADVSEAMVKRAMAVYLTKPWADIAGYRPWTHWNFIRGLKESERDRLAKEIADYIKKNGVRDVKQ